MKLYLGLLMLTLIGCATNSPTQNAQVTPEKNQVDRQGIRKTIAKHRRHVSNCYGRSLTVKGNEQLKGTMMVFFKIGPDGQAVDAKVNTEKSDLVNQSLGDCIIAGLKTWDFPVHPDGEEVGVNYPFVFRATPPANMQKKLDRFQNLKKRAY